ISGLRAVFGEKYPDPVRVVSVGAPIDALLTDPGDPAWADLSVEFCGGSHLSNTGEARAFAIIAEEAVAKGVRRIQAVTGAPAEAAIEAGHRLLDRAKAAKHADDATLLEEVAQLQGQMEALTLPLALRRKAQRAIAELQDKVKQARKKEAAAGKDEAIEAARQVASGASGEVIVAQVPAGSNREALLAAMDTVQAKHASAAIMLLSADDAEGKVTIVAKVAEPLVKRGLKAGDWVREASAAVGGKGGGRPDSAQGGGTEPAKVVDAVGIARTFASSKLG
ncbi:MAG: DHHA1 domain-containing protein, partial [Phycisphaerales bacterium]